jgi:hypothetical protein
MIKLIKKYSVGLVKSYLIKVAVIIVLVIIAIGVIFKTISYSSSRYACHVQWVESGIEYKYTLRGGCLLKRGTGWIPAKNFRVE